MASFQSLGYDVYILDVHSYHWFGEQRVYNNQGINIGAPASWHPPSNLTEYEHVRFMTHVFRVDGNLSMSGWGKVIRFLPAPVNILVTLEPLIDPRPKQINPGDFTALRKKYGLPWSMDYHYPRCGYHPSQDRRVKCPEKDA